jgi:hypothetical protein
MPTADTTPALDHVPEDAMVVESDLASARDATARLDTEACERWLARAEGRLRAHPELPQSALLMAEVQRAWATRFARLEPKDEGRAGRARAAADALDGGRATGVGEAFGATVSPRPPAAIPITIAYEDGAEVRVDGRELPREGPHATSLSPGEHHVTVARAGVVRFAQWVALAEGAALRLPSVDPGACSSADVARVRVPTASSEPTPSGVRCGAWVAARAGERPGTVRLAWCAGSTCGPSTTWSPPTGVVWPVRVENASHGLHIPAWLVWTTAGVAVLGVTAAILFASGVFDASPHTTRFVQGGARVE